MSRDYISCGLLSEIMVVQPSKHESQSTKLRATIKFNVRSTSIRFNDDSRSPRPRQPRQRLDVPCSSFITRQRTLFDFGRSSPCWFATFWTSAKIITARCHSEEFIPQSSGIRCRDTKVRSCDWRTNKKEPSFSLAPFSTFTEERNKDLTAYLRIQSNRCESICLRNLHLCPVGNHLR